MILGLAEAGADIVGVDYVGSEETKAKVEAFGRKFHEVKADLISAKKEDLVALVEIQ